MFGAWWKLGMDTTMLVLESQAVVGLRLAKLAAGGTAAQAEAQRMVGEKIAAAGEATMLIATGGSPERIISSYRRKVRANRKRLTKR